MKNRPNPTSISIVLSWLVLCAILALPGRAHGATEAPAPSAPATTTLKPEQLEQLVAPIALYPDALLAQIFMASTYPLEVVEAARWLKDNPKVTGKALEDAMQKQNWDPSVKSLPAVPQVLTMMNDKLDWTQQLGDAFLSNQKGVLDAVQRLRAKAEAAGTLKDSPQMKVSSSSAPAPSSASHSTESVSTTTQYITIESADPEVVYVPSYNPTVAYGSWPYPSYPPYSYYPPGYVAGTALLSFGIGMAVGGALWGNCNWGGGDVNINTNRYNNFNRTNINNKNWNHNNAHRRNVPYGNQNLSQKFGGKRDVAARQARDQFRGRANAGRTELGGNMARGTRAGNNGLDRRGNQGALSDRGLDRGGGVGQDRNALGNRSRDGGQSFGDRNRSSGAFSGVGRGSETRQFSQRGNSSMRSSGFSGSRSGVSSRGGGGARAGGARGGGGGRRR